MSNNNTSTSGIVSKVWAFCNTLRDEILKEHEKEIKGTKKALKR